MNDCARNTTTGRSHGPDPSERNAIMPRHCDPIVFDRILHSLRAKLQAGLETQVDDALFYASLAQARDHLYPSTDAMRESLGVTHKLLTHWANERKAPVGWLRSKITRRLLERLEEVAAAYAESTAPHPPGTAHPLVFGPIRGGSLINLVSGLEDADIDLVTIYQHCDATFRGKNPSPLSHPEHKLLQLTFLVRYLVAELHAVEEKLPAADRSDRCPMCGFTCWSRPLRIDATLAEACWHDFTRRECRACHHVRPEPETAPEEAEEDEGTSEGEDCIVGASVSPADRYTRLPSGRLVPDPEGRWTVVESPERADARPPAVAIPRTLEVLENLDDILGDDAWADLEDDTARSHLQERLELLRGMIAPRENSSS